MSEAYYLEITKYENIKFVLNRLADNFEEYLEKADDVPLFLLGVELFVEKSGVISYLVAVANNFSKRYSNSIGRAMAKNYKGYPVVRRETRKAYILPGLDEIRAKLLPYYKKLILPDKKKVSYKLQKELDSLEQGG